MPKTPRRKSKRVEEVETMDVDDESPPAPSQSSSSSVDQNQGSTSSEGSPQSSDDPPGPSDNSISPQTPRRSLRRSSASPPLDETSEDLQEDQNSSPEVMAPPRKPKPSRKTRHLSPEPVPIDQDCLFNKIKQFSMPLKDLAVQWTRSYIENPQEATAKLLEFFLHSSNCPITLTPQHLDNIEETLPIILAASKNDPKDSPLTLKIPPWPKFTSNLIDFITILFFHIQDSIIYDDYLLPTINLFLVELSVSQIRSLRHASTLILLKLLTILQKIDLKVKSKKEKVTHQLASENAKSLGERSRDRQETLQQRIEEFSENRRELNRLIDDILKSVFIPRYRDILPEIRHICLDELAIWLKLRPIKYLHNLNSIGDGLSDKSPNIRLQSLKILQTIYSSENMKNHLQGFNNKFKRRICAMVLDKDDKVAIETSKLMKIIYDHHKNILSDSDYEIIYQLVLCRNRSLAQISGDFLISVCSTDDLDDSGDTQRTDDSILQQLINFFGECEKPEYAAYLVDALIDNHEVIKNWGCMTHFLLSDVDEVLNNDEVLNLVKIMVSSIEESATGEIPDGRGPSKKVLNAREQRKVCFDREVLTAHFIKVLPRLLAKFRTDDRILSNLLKIPQFFYLDIYVKSHQEDKLEHLLDEMKEIIEITSDLKTLGAAAETLGFLCSENHPKQSICDIQRNIIIENMIENCKKSIKQYERIIETDGPDDNKKMDFVVSIKKIAIFNCCHDTNRYNVCQYIYKIIEASLESPDRYPEEGIIYTMQVCFYSFLWGRSNLNSQDSSEDDGKDLKEFLDKFIEDVKLFMNDDKWCFGIREHAFTIISDLLITFNHPICEETNELIQEIVYKADDNLKDIMNTFIQENVFIHENSNLDDYYKRRTLLMSFCKLIMCGVFPVKTAADIFKHYLPFYNDYGDIIKMILGKIKDISKKNWALTMQLSLNKLFDEGMEKGEGHIDVEDFKGMIDVAKKFADLLGNDASKNKEEVAAIHLAGINFVVNGPEGEELSCTDVPNKIEFLEVLMEFSRKLSKEGKRIVVKVLDVKLPIGRARGEEWKALEIYRKSLVGGEGDGSGEPDVSKERGQRKKTANKTPLNVRKVKDPKGKRVTIEGDSVEDIHSVSQDIRNRLNRVGDAPGREEGDMDVDCED